MFFHESLYIPKGFAFWVRVCIFGLDHLVRKDGFIGFFKMGMVKAYGNGFVISFGKSWLTRLQRFL